MKMEGVKPRLTSAGCPSAGSGGAAGATRPRRKHSEVTPPRIINHPPPTRKFSQATPPKSILRNYLKEMTSEESSPAATPPKTHPEMVKNTAEPRMRKTSRVHFNDEKLTDEIPARYQQWSPEPEYPSTCQPAFTISPAMSVEAKYLILQSYEDELLERVSSAPAQKNSETRADNASPTTSIENGVFALELDACDAVKRDRDDASDVSPDPYIAYGRLTRLVEKVRDEKRHLLRSNEEFLHWFQSLRMALDELDRDCL